MKALGLAQGQEKMQTVSLGAGLSALFGFFLSWIVALISLALFLQLARFITGATIPDSLNVLLMLLASGVVFAGLNAFLQMVSIMNYMPPSLRRKWSLFTFVGGFAYWLIVWGLLFIPFGSLLYTLSTWQDQGLAYTWGESRVIQVSLAVMVTASLAGSLTLGAIQAYFLQRYASNYWRWTLITVLGSAMLVGFVGGVFVWLAGTD